LRVELEGLLVVRHGSVLAQEDVLADLAEIEERGGPGLLALDPLSLTLELLEQSGPNTRTTEALRYLFAELHEQAILQESWGKWIVERRTFYNTHGDGDQSESGPSPRDSCCAANRLIDDCVAIVSVQARPEKRASGGPGADVPRRGRGGGRLGR